MRWQEYFNPRRFFLLLRNDIFSHYKMLLIAATAVYGFLIIVNIASVASWSHWSFNTVFFSITLITGGFIMTSLAFKDLHHRERGVAYLTLPASQLEKLAAKLLLTAVGYIAATLILFWFASLLAAGLTKLIFGMAHPLFNPFQAEVGRAIVIYIITHSIFLFGAVYFKRQAFLKTVAALFIISILMGLAAFGAARLIFWPYFEGITWTGGELSNRIILGGGDAPAAVSFYCSTLLPNAAVFFRFLLAPLLWILSYLRLTESEARG